MVSNIFQRATWVGTEAERLVTSPDATGSTFYCSDSDIAYWWDGSAWVVFGGTSSTIKEVVFSSSGTLSVTSGVTRVYNSMGISFHATKVLLGVNTAPVGDNIIVDVHKNGVTIFTNQANRPVILDGTNTGETTTIDLPDWNDDDYYTVDVDNIGSGTAGSNLTVHITIEQV